MSRFELQQNMNMVGVGFDCRNDGVLFRCDVQANLFNSIADFSRQYGSPIFHTPYQMEMENMFAVCRTICVHFVFPSQSFLTLNPSLSGSESGTSLSHSVESWSASFLKVWLELLVKALALCDVVLNPRRSLFLFVKTLIDCANYIFVKFYNLRGKRCYHSSSVTDILYLVALISPVPPKLRYLTCKFYNCFVSIACQQILMKTGKIFAFVDQVIIHIISKIFSSCKFIRHFTKIRICANVFYIIFQDFVCWTRFSQHRYRRSFNVCNLFVHYIYSSQVLFLFLSFELFAFRLAVLDYVSILHDVI